MDQEKLNAFGGPRIKERQIDELIGLAKGITADGFVHDAEAEFLQAWLAANAAISGQPLIANLYRRVRTMLQDNFLDETERQELFETLAAFGSERIEAGESMKSTTLPLSDPAPVIVFPGMRYAFTGTFNYGHRGLCEEITTQRGAEVGSLTAKTHFLIIGAYATESWKHSSFGNKILKACEMQGKGLPVHIVSEDHWAAHL